MKTASVATQKSFDEGHLFLVQLGASQKHKSMDCTQNKYIRLQ